MSDHVVGTDQNKATWVQLLDKLKKIKIEDLENEISRREDMNKKFH